MSEDPNRWSSIREIQDETDGQLEEEQLDEEESNEYPNLIACTDCGYMHSQSALFCPDCGRMIQRIAVIVDRQGWPWTIGWGILAAVAISAAITVLFWVVILLIFGFARIAAPTNH
jgi:hypothetical protein